MGPTWNCNYLRLPKGCRPAILTYTPLNHDTGAGRLDLDVVLHERGAVAAWAQGAAPGDPAAISRPGRGYEIDPQVTSYVLAGDEAELPAIGHHLQERKRAEQGKSVSVPVELGGLSSIQKK